MLAATDHNTITPATQVLIQAMREAGINVDVQSMDWGIGGLAPRQEEAAGTGRLEHLRHHLGRRRLGQSGAAHLDRRGLRQGPVRLAVRSRGREAAQRLRLGRGRGRAQEDRQGTADAGDGRRVYLPFGQWDMPLAYRADRSRASCPTPAWPCCGGSRRSSAAGSAAPQCRSLARRSGAEAPGCALRVP